MHVAIVIENFNPAAGGNEKSTLQIAQGLLNRGHKVTILTNRIPDGLSLPGAHIIARNGIAPSRALGFWIFRHWAIRRLDRDNYDASLSVTMAVPASFICPRTGTTLENRKRNIERRPTTFRRLIKQLLVAANPKQQVLALAEYFTVHSPRVRKIIAISPYVAHQLVHHYTVPMRRIQLIPNGAIIPAIPPDQRAHLRASLRPNLNLTNRDVVFLFAATNPHLKGLTPLLHAMKHLQEDQPRAKLLVAGSFSRFHQRLAEHLDLPSVRWIGPTSSMNDLFTISDVTVMPTFYDAANKVILESLMHSVPVITTLYAGTSHWVSHPAPPPAMVSPYQTTDLDHPAAAQPAGRVINEPDNISALAGSMKALCDDEERARCTAAASSLAPHLHMDRHVEKLEQLLQSLAAKPVTDPS